MKYFPTLALASALLAGAPLAQAQVGVSIDIRQPGVYGRIDIGSAPPPPVVYAKPVIYAPPRVVVQQEPVYLYVPPGHQKKWGRYCKRYDACGRPVYFVRETWVRERWEHEHGHGHGPKGRGPKGHDHDHGHRDDHGRGRGRD